jgi:hypothetical protein
MTGGVKQPGSEAVHLIYLVQRLSMTEAIPSHPHTPSWHAEGHIYLQKWQ